MMTSSSVKPCAIFFFEFRVKKNFGFRSDSSGNFTGVVVTKGNADPRNNNKTDNKVDAIAGSTITGNGVTSMIKDELKLYIPYFKTKKNS